MEINTVNDVFNKEELDETTDSVTPDMETTTSDDSVTVATEAMVGIVDCHALNVRSMPDKNSEIVCVINNGSEVVIDPKESTDMFYKVYTESGAEGFCVKDFVRITEGAL